MSDQNRPSNSESSEAAFVYRSEPLLPKPCVHPLKTPLGTTLTGFEMSDHVWHRGLWFAIKFINGTNFWEENAPFGGQIGNPPVIERGDDGSVHVRQSLTWWAEATGEVFDEERVVVYHEAADGVRLVDWETRLTAKQDLQLDRTPYTTWGGYSGLTFRGSRELHQVSYEVPGRNVVPEIVGDRYEWVVMRATVDGGRDRRVSVGIIDHPSNPSSPTPWYCRSGTGYTFFNAAFLFHGPRAFRNGEVLTFKYRVAFRDGEWPVGDFADLATAYQAAE